MLDHDLSLNISGSNRPGQPVLQSYVESNQPDQSNLEFQREVIRHITEIGSSLRLQMDTDTLLSRVAEAACKALRFDSSALYLADDKGFFWARATWNAGPGGEMYLQEHPVPEDVVALLIDERHRLGDSYFIPAEAPIWQNEYVNSFFITENSASPAASFISSSDIAWHPEDMIIVPLVSGDNALLGFLTPDAPLNGRRPTAETIGILEMFVNQAAVVIEGTRLYQEARQTSEERAALIEIGRALSAPDAQRDLQTVYQTIYEQVRRVMPADSFFVTRYNQATDALFLEYFVDMGKVYPATAYKYTPARTRNLLFHTPAGQLFATSEEYRLFVEKEDPGVQENPIESDPEFGSSLMGEKRTSQSFLYVPIGYGGEPIGLLSAQSYQPHAHTYRHLEMLKEIGVQAGIAITNARLNTELRDALKQAQESERLKNHFLMTASHELRTPLTAIQGYLELLGNYSSVLDDEAKNRFINNARRACEELVLLLGNVMDTSRVDQDKVSLNLGPVQVIDAVQLILEILEPTILSEGRPVEVNVADNLYVWVDELRLRQVLLNVVGNALKYTPAPTKLAISAHPIDRETLEQRLLAVSAMSFEQRCAITADQLVVIAVRDWGPGISADDQIKLFTKFMRLDSAMNSLQRGAGLGLYLCRQLTEAMGGSIWVESTGLPGEGTIFSIALPFHKN